MKQAFTHTNGPIIDDNMAYQANKEYEDTPDAKCRRQRRCLYEKYHLHVFFVGSENDNEREDAIVEQDPKVGSHSIGEVLKRRRQEHQGGRNPRHSNPP